MVFGIKKSIVSLEKISKINIRGELNNGPY
jgi:hypothetical protein